VYAASRHMSCRDVTTVMSGNDLTNNRPWSNPGAVWRVVLLLGRRITPIVTRPPAHAGQPYRPPLDPAAQTLNDQRVSRNPYQPHPGEFHAADAFRRMLVRFAHGLLPRTRRTSRVLHRKKCALAHHQGRAFTLPCSYNTPAARRLRGAPAADARGGVAGGGLGAVLALDADVGNGPQSAHDVADGMHVEVEADRRIGQARANHMKLLAWSQMGVDEDK
jgi:hypothetical protein